jgi:hypothetical protein
MDKQKYYKEYYIKHKEYILKQKADWRELNRQYNNQTGHRVEFLIHTHSFIHPYFMNIIGMK